MNRVTVWHDGDCPLCRREIALMRRLDTRGAITFVDATAPPPVRSIGPRCWRVSMPARRTGRCGIRPISFRERDERR
jgi:hypothetical protein